MTWSIWCPIGRCSSSSTSFELASTLTPLLLWTRSGARNGSALATASGAKQKPDGPRRDDSFPACSSHALTDHARDPIGHKAVASESAAPSSVPARGRVHTRALSRMLVGTAWPQPLWRSIGSHLP
jgi:hypothetical protein